MVKLAKQALLALSHGILTEDEFRTVLGTAEYHVNERPLGYITTDAGEHELLTPRHFLVESVAGMLPAAFLSEGGIPLGTRENPIEDYRTAAEKYNALTIAVRAFKEQYFEMLIPILNRINYGPNKDNRGLQVGDVVAMLEPGCKQGSWPIGIIEKVSPGDDQRVRTVTVRTRTQNVQKKKTKSGKIKLVVKPHPPDLAQSERASQLLGYKVKVPRAGRECFYKRHVQHLMLLESADDENKPENTIEWPDVMDEEDDQDDDQAAPAAQQEEIIEPSGVAPHASTEDNAAAQADVAENAALPPVDVAAAPQVVVAPGAIADNQDVRAATAKRTPAIKRPTLTVGKRARHVGLAPTRRSERLATKANNAAQQ